jgi:F-type H+-transporting ATPase subunit delta
MLNPRLAGRYAKALLDLAIEKGMLEAVNDDMLYLQQISRTNKDFVNLLKSPVISSEKKVAILGAVTAGKIGELTNSFISLLIRKGRELNLPEIANAFVEQYKTYNNIYSVKLTTAHPISDTLKQEIVDKVKSQTEMQNIALTTETNEELIGGFVLEVGGTLVDASIAYDLNTIRKQFLNNDFIYKIR